MLSLILAKASTARRLPPLLLALAACFATAVAAQESAPVPSGVESAQQQAGAPAAQSATGPAAEPVQAPPAQSPAAENVKPAEMAPAVDTAEPGAGEATPPATGADEPPAVAPEQAAGAGSDAVAPADTGPASASGQVTPGAATPDDAAPAAAASASTPTAAAHDNKLPHDLSPWGMFQGADIIVKAVMVGLAIASFATWTVWVAKSIELSSAKRRLRRAIAHINASESLHDATETLGGRAGTAGALVRSAAEELVKSAPVLDHTSGEGVLARITSRLTRIEAAAARRITLGTGVLATIGATAPFVGLFGTVWGIMNAFIGISETQTTNLAVVAPGIAEALMATALGLVAAIPAVVIYNVFSRSTAGYRQLLADAAAGVERLVSRDLDFRHVPAAPSPAMFMRAAE